MRVSYNANHELYYTVQSMPVSRSANHTRGIQNILDRLLLVFPRSRTEKKALAWTEDTRVSLLYQLLEPDPLQSGLHPVVFTGPLGPRCLRCVTVVYSPRPPLPPLP